MANVKITRSKIEGDYSIFVNFDDKYYNCIVPGFGISFFTQKESEIDSLAHDLVIRFFKIRMAMKGNTMHKIAQELLEKGFTSLSTDPLRRAKINRPLTLRGSDKSPANYEFHGTGKLAA